MVLAKTSLSQIQKIGPCKFMLGASDQGHLSASGATVKWTPSTLESMSARFGEEPLGAYEMGGELNVELELSQTEFNAFAGTQIATLFGDVDYTTFGQFRRGDDDGSADLVGGFSPLIRLSFVDDYPVVPFASFSDLPRPIAAAAAFQSDKTFYLIGGENELGESNEVYAAVLDGANGLGPWVKQDSMPVAKKDPGVARWRSWVYVAGGRDLNGDSNLVLRTQVGEDGFLGQWEAANPLPLPVTSGRLVACKGFLFFVGGLAAGATTGRVFSTPIHADGKIGDWTEKTALPVPLKGFAIAGAHGFLWVLGGDDGTTVSNKVYVAQVQNDGSLGAWVQDPTLMPLPRTSLYSGPCSDSGFLFVLGGEGDTLGSQKANRNAHRVRLTAGGSTTAAWVQLSSPDPIPEERAAGAMFFGGGFLWYAGGYDLAGKPVATVYQKSKNSAPNAADAGDYRSGMDFGSEFDLAGYELFVDNSSSPHLQVQWRAAKSDGVFSAWSSLQSSPAALSGIARFLEFRLAMTQPPGFGVTVTVNAIRVRKVGGAAPGKAVGFGVEPGSELQAKVLKLIPEAKEFSRGGGNDLTFTAFRAVQMGEPEIAYVGSGEENRYSVQFKCLADKSKPSTLR